MKAKPNYGNPEKGKKSTGGYDQQRLKKDRIRAGRVNEDQPANFTGAPGPRVGGKAQKSAGMATGTANKKDLKASVRRIKQSGRSKAAKKSAIKAIRG